jgi:hypothetical protein
VLFSRNKISLTIFTCVSAWSTAHTEAAVTYLLDGGRLGDKLLSYLHAKWVSHVYKIPLLYKPFPYSDQLILHTQEIQYNSYDLGKFSHFFELKKNQQLVVNPSSQTLYTIPYFPESREELQAPEPGLNANNLIPNLGNLRKEFPYFEVDWSDREFLHKIRQMIKPLNTLSLIKPPQDGRINVAVHVRKNSGGYDLPLLHDLPAEQYNPDQVYVDVIFPLKHAPDEYFMENIKKIYNLYKQPLYVFLFTDDPNPSSILEKYKRTINNKNITIECRMSGDNNHYSNVLEDLFSILNFDCFIRADSNLTIVASKLIDFQVLITPAHHRWEGRKLIIDKVDVAIRPDILNKFEAKKIKTIFNQEPLL